MKTFIKIFPTHKTRFIKTGKYGIHTAVKIYDGDSVIEKICNKLNIKTFKHKTRYSDKTRRYQ